MAKLAFRVVLGDSWKRPFLFVSLFIICLTASYSMCLI